MPPALAKRSAPSGFSLAPGAGRQGITRLVAFSASAQVSKLINGKRKGHFYQSGLSGNQIGLQSAGPKPERTMSGGESDQRAALSFGTAVSFEREQCGAPITEEIVPVRDMQAILSRLDLPFHGGEHAPLISVKERNLPSFAAGGLLQEKFDGILDFVGRGCGHENITGVLDEDLKAAGTSSAAREDRIFFKR